MTREEIEELKGLAASMGLYDDKNPCKRAVILGKAIKALEKEPKTGHWILKSPSPYEPYRCTNCNRTGVRAFDFCPHCGAKMIEPQESEG